MLGGCSSINAMIPRGNPATTWARGQIGLRRSLPCSSVTKLEPGASAYRGVDTVATCAIPIRCPAAFIQACQQVGLPLNDDHNGAAQKGSGSIASRRRMVSDTAPPLPSSRLQTVTTCRSKPMPSPSACCSTQAPVAYCRTDRRSATANREVIVSGGHQLAATPDALGHRRW
jgi:hypothetical protein